ncbi:MAG: DUF4337 domain-containing protein [Bdellovibrionota bacterium]
MEEIEVPIEEVQERLHEAAEEAKEQWIGRVALSSAILAGLAAVAALLSGHHSNEAMIDQIQASDHWSYYQAKSIKSSMLESRAQILFAINKTSSQGTEEKLAEYKKELEEIQAEAKAKEVESRAHLVRHANLAKSVTFFQVAIAVGAISVLMRRRKYWYLSLGFGAVGLFFFLQEFLH